jgi:hypothetical protein
MAARTDAKADGFHRPSLDAFHYADLVDRRVTGRSAQVRYRFVEATQAEVDAPMATMLRGGRGGSVRLKLYLSILWFAANPPYDVSYPARAWASLLDLDNPETNGARRITDAVAWLGEHRLLHLERKQGRPTRIYLLADDGTGEPYRPPGKILEELRAKGVDPRADEFKRHLYLQLPAHFWTNGWLAGLSGLGIAMLLALLAEQRDKDAGSELWFSPRLAKQRFGLSEDARTAGFRQLEIVRLASMRRRPVNRDAFEFARMRNTYTLDRARLEKRIGA